MTRYVHSMPSSYAQTLAAIFGDSVAVTPFPGRTYVLATLPQELTVLLQASRRVCRGSSRQERIFIRWAREPALVDSVRGFLAIQAEEEENPAAVMQRAVEAVLVWKG